MIDEFLKKVYFKVKELFTERENPLYDSFYKDETKGFEEFKNNAQGDDTLKWIFEGRSLSDENVYFTAGQIINKINRYYYMSGQSARNKKHCPECTAEASFDEDLGIWKCTECEWKGDL